MDVFALRDRLVADYEEFTRSFIHVSDDRIREVVDRELAEGLLWPESLIQLNPSFQPGATIDDLVAEGVLHDANRAIFRRGKTEGAAGAAGSEPLRLHRHQEEAIRVATTGANYVLTTGTGSGKSLTYIVPIVDRVLREGPGKGIRAIVVYPMNALANSQVGELEKFLKFGYPDNAGPVTFARYTGQEKEEQRQAIIATPPDILLTNYVMLELLLTRPIEKGLVEAARGLRFLVLDELHTYRGRQGADVALLVRRVREATKATSLQVVGTSATLAGSDAIGHQKVEIAAVASRLFGATVEPANVVDETLVRATQPPRAADPAWVAALRTRVASGSPAPTAAAAFQSDPLASWIEGVIGLQEEPGTGRLVRARPRAIGGPDGAATMLAGLVGLDEERSAAAIRETLYAGFRVTLPGSVFPVFAFRLHQFFSRGDTVFASLEAEGSRYLTTHGQQFVPGDRNRVLLPLAFCRECGQDYYTVGRRKDLSGTYTYEPRELSDVTADEDRDRGFVYVGSENPWPDDPAGEAERVPDDWLEEKADGRLVVKSDRKKNLPSTVHIGADGRESPGGLRVAFMPAPFKFCLSCGVEYSNRQTRDLGKLATLGSGGRSSATSLLSITAVRSLRHDETLEPRARKLLAFTDNRQDASLQAGHLNDTVEVGLLRSALYRAAAAAGDAGLGHDELAIRVADALHLPIAEYARDPAVKFAAKAQTDAALRDVLGYRLYRDLERGWRVTAPNLEQAGLLEIRYESLDELAAADEEWASAHPALAAATPTQRRDVGKALLDHLRRELAIHVDFLREDWQEGMRRRSNERLVLPWAIDEEERLDHAAVAYPRGRKKAAAPDYGGNVYLSPLGGLGQLMGRPGVLADTGKRLVTADRERIIRELCTILKIAGLLLVVDEPKEAGAVPGYQLASASMRWHAGDGTAAFHDPIRVPKAPEAGLAVNPYFVRFYREVAGDGVGIRAKEHTAQVASAEREEREEAFREGRLPILFCSPTMELGIDIAELNVVGLRNVPPTPANYAQRSGRAGRSGQPALVFAYCSTGSPHDAYFFRRPELMVAGQVKAPRLELVNEDLVRSHVHAIWLRAVDKTLGRSLADILDVSGQEPTLALLPEVSDVVRAPAARAVAKVAAAAFLDSVDLTDADWYTERWLDETLDAAPLRFDAACGRWRDLYRAALEMRATQNKVIGDASRSADDRDRARRLRAEAESQLEILRGEGAESTMQADFYSYRYFASEGFLPGYSFPRLPLSAWIPGRAGPAKHDDYLSRPRFLAISEFGPRSIVYHEGSRYLINRVLLPADRTEENQLVLHAAKRCPACGYLHPVDGAGVGVDTCRRCGADLDEALGSLFRLSNVATKRRDRINSDEEERQRMGFEVRSAIAFAGPPVRPNVHKAEAGDGAGAILGLEYGPAATIWRMNVGWRRRKKDAKLGFVLDTERGYWQRNDLDPDDKDDPLSGRTERVIPYVEDRRNVLLVSPAEELSPEEMASLAAALKNAIQVEFQLEDAELAAEPLPSESRRRVILLYEAAEGGAGVLRRLAREPGALPAVARRALELCHFDPATGEDRGSAKGARERCEAACYDCLLSYGNQRDHRLLDRQRIRGLLLRLAAAEVSISDGPEPPEVHLAMLKALAWSDLERRWLDFLHARGYVLPATAQRAIPNVYARPDFAYDTTTVVFIDGPVHGYANIAERDTKIRDTLDAAGYLVIAFGPDEATWPEVLAKYPNVFGKPIAARATS